MANFQQNFPFLSECLISDEEDYLSIKEPASLDTAQSDGEPSAPSLTLTAAPSPIMFPLEMSPITPSFILFGERNATPPPALSEMILPPLVEAPETTVNVNSDSASAVVVIPPLENPPVVPVGERPVRIWEPRGSGALRDSAIAMKTDRQREFQATVGGIQYRCWTYILRLAVPEQILVGGDYMLTVNLCDNAERVVEGGLVPQSQDPALFEGDGPTRVARVVFKYMTSSQGTGIRARRFRLYAAVSRVSDNSVLGSLVSTSFETKARRNKNDQTPRVYKRRGGTVGFAEAQRSRLAPTNGLTNVERALCMRFFADPSRLSTQECDHVLQLMVRSVSHLRVDVTDALRNVLGDFHLA